MRVTVRLPFSSAGLRYRVGLSPVRLVVVLAVLTVLPLLYLSLGGGPALLCSRSPIRTVCSQVESGLALGSLCHDLCHLHAISPLSCPPWHRAKDVVFSALWRQSVPVVGKARTLDLDTESQHVVFWTAENNTLAFSSIADFQLTLENHLKINYNLSLPNKKGLLSLWPHSLNKESLTEEENAWLRQSSMKNIWTLSLDPEFVYSQLFKEFDVFPEVYGTCGGLFFVEKLEPLDLPYFLQSLDFGGWVARAKLALAILDLVEELDTMFDFPLHLCDVKSEHFGISGSGRVKYLDGDNVYLKPVADRTVGDGSPCSRDSDCHLFDCTGRCDLDENKCSGPVRNSNLQVVCSKIFLNRKIGLKFLGGSGLLLSKHASAGLLETLEACAEGEGEEDRVINNLRTQLKEVVFISEQLES